MHEAATQRESWRWHASARQHGSSSSTMRHRRAVRLLLFTYALNTGGASSSVVTALLRALWWLCVFTHAVIACSRITGCLAVSPGRCSVQDSFIHRHFFCYIGITVESCCCEASKRHKTMHCQQHCCSSRRSAQPGLIAACSFTCLGFAGGVALCIEPQRAWCFSSAWDTMNCFAGVFILVASLHWQHGMHAIWHSGG